MGFPSPYSTPTSPRALCYSSSRLPPRPCLSNRPHWCGVLCGDGHRRTQLPSSCPSLFGPFRNSKWLAWETGSGDGGNRLVSVRLRFRRQRGCYIEIPYATFDGGLPPMFHGQNSLHKLDHQKEQLEKSEFLGVLERPHCGLHMEPICN